MHTTHDRSPLSPSPADPWSDILLPATLGEHAAATAAMARHEAETPAAGRPLLYAVSARALFALGHGSTAEAVLDGALALGGAAAAAVASVARPDGERWCRARLSLGGPGDRADAWCDLAWLRACEGELDGAAAAVEQAGFACRGHAEGERWARFLADAGEEAAELLRRAPAADPPRAGRPAARDAWELAPRPELGMLSAERSLRRLGSGAWTAPARRPSGLARLQDMGVATRMVAMDVDQQAIAPNHRLVALEAQVDRLCSLLAEGRDSGAAARALWADANALDREAALDAANVLVPHGITAPEARPVALAAVEVLIRRDPGLALWRAYRCHLWAAEGDPRGAAEARALLDLGLEHGLELHVALDALHRSGAQAEARRRARALCAGGPDAQVARSLLAAWEQQLPLRPMAGPRVRPRFPVGHLP